MIGRKPDKFGPPIRAERIEVISAHVCLECGHVITDHKRAGQHEEGRKDQAERWKVYAKRDYCIGAHGTCPCRLFRQPHEPKISVRVG